MNHNSTFDQPKQMADQAAAGADAAIRSTQKAVTNVLDGMADSATSLRATVTPAIGRASDRMSDLAHRGAEAVGRTSTQLRDRAADASERTRGYVRDEPVKSVLIAAATGAVLMGLLSLITSVRHRV